MPRKPSSKDGRPRVPVSSTISAKAHDFLVTTTARLKAKNPKAAMGQAIDSLVDFAEARKFDPIRLMKTKRPVKSFDTPTGRPATHSAAKA